MNKVYVQVDSPEALWCKGPCESGKDGIRYAAKFCKSGTSPKPMHLGPSITLYVKDPSGKVIESQSATVGIRSDGSMFLQSYVEHASELELGKGGA